VQGVAFAQLTRAFGWKSKSLILLEVTIALWFGGQYALRIRRFSSVQSGTKMNRIANAAQPKPKLTALPLLVVLFLISYSLLTKLVIEQNRTIDSQRSLIHSLFKDNISLSTFYEHARTLPGKSEPQTDIRIEPEPPASQSSSSQTSSAQGPLPPARLAQVPSNRVESGKVGPQASTKNHRKRSKAEKPLPATPPAELTNPSDMRRVWFST
jgi:hypothetical protein